MSRRNQFLPDYDATTAFASPPDDDYSGSAYLDSLIPSRNVPPTLESKESTADADAEARDARTTGSAGAQTSADWSFYVNPAAINRARQYWTAAEHTFWMFPVWLVYAAFHKTHILVSVILLLLVVVATVYAVFDTPVAGETNGRTVYGATAYSLADEE